MSSASYRGQPLVALMVLLGGWVAVRAVLLAAAGSGPAASTRPAAARLEEGTQPAPLRRAVLAKPNLPNAEAAPRFVPTIAAQFHSVPGKQLSAMRSVPMLRALVPPERSSALPVPLLQPSILAQTSDPGRGEAAHRDPRWSADGWLLLRRGGRALPAGGLAPPIYGASQLGAVVRYRLAPQSAHRPALYLRGSAALNGSREGEVAFGVSVRPVAGLPVVVAAEARINDQPSGTHARPAAFVYTEMPPIDLPMGTRAEFYGQAGYVGGDFASAFADGQMRIDRRVAAIGDGELRAGGGVWGGAQHGASRVDLGPTVTLGLPLGGGVGARLAVDWRFRIAGKAEPDSGPTLTLSAGF